MGFSITQTLSESWDDFVTLVTNPTILILFIVSATLSVIPEFLANEESPLFVFLFIPVLFAIIFVYIYQILLIYENKRPTGQNLLSITLSIYLRYLWYTIIFIGIILGVMIAIGLPAGILYFILKDSTVASVAILAIASIIFFCVLIFLSVRLFFYTYFIIIIKDPSPMVSSWNTTKPYFWKLFLLFIALLIISMLIILPVELGLTEFMGLEEKMAALILVPLDAVISLFMSIAFLNAFLVCYKQPSATE